jgi:hypothetical protein
MWKSFAYSNKKLHEMNQYTKRKTFSPCSVGKVVKTPVKPD